MNNLMQMANARRLFLAAATSLLLAACGASTILTAGISGTGIVVGVLTGFGSIYVNGVEYDIDQAEFDIDGQTSFTDAAEAQQNLAIGMVVRLEATDNGDGTGTAVRVVYDDSVEGPIETMPALVGGDPNRMQFAVLGQNIVADQFDTSFEGMSFADLDQGLVVEVSGFIDGAGNILATRIEKKGEFVPGETEVELRGQVANLQSGSFDLGTTRIEYDGNTGFEDMQPDDLANGLHIEVKGIYQTDGSVLASKIESEDDDREAVSSSEGEVELQGVIYNFVSAADFFVNGVRVDASGLSEAERNALAEGLEIEIRGSMENTVLIAESIEFRGAEAELKGRLASVDEAAASLTVNFSDAGESLQVAVTSESQLKDDRMNAGDEAITLTELAAAVGSSGPIEVSLSIRKQDGDWIVVNLKLKDSVDEYEVEGIVEGIDTTATPMTLTLFGVALPLDGIDVAFLNGLTVGSTKVELKDTDKDGDFDQAELEDDD